MLEKRLGDAASILDPVRTSVLIMLPSAPGRGERGFHTDPDEFWELGGIARLMIVWDLDWERIQPFRKLRGVDPDLSF
jgi:hypothetical protein